MKGVKNHTNENDFFAFSDWKILQTNIEGQRNRINKEVKKHNKLKYYLDYLVLPQHTSNTVEITVKTYFPIFP